MPPTNALAESRDYLSSAAADANGHSLREGKRTVSVGQVTEIIK
jgi:hypothetical protein